LGCVGSLTPNKEVSHSKKLHEGLCRTRDYSVTRLVSWPLNRQGHERTYEGREGHDEDQELQEVVATLPHLRLDLLPRGQTCFGTGLDRFRKSRSEFSTIYSIRTSA